MITAWRKGICGRQRCHCQHKAEKSFPDLCFHRFMNPELLLHDKRPFWG
jgi:hypothetical protein